MRRESRWRGNALAVHGPRRKVVFPVFSRPVGCFGAFRRVGGSTLRLFVTVRWAVGVVGRCEGGSVSDGGVGAGEAPAVSVAGPGLVPGSAPWRGAAVECALTAVMMFLVVTMVRWLLDPASPVFIADLQLALGVVGALVAVLLVGLILSPPGRGSGAHLNPAVSVALWLMRAFPGRAVVPYAIGQLLGGLAGTALARLVWGPVLQSAALSDGLARPAPGRSSVAVFALEAASFAAVALLIGFFVAHPGLARPMPYAVGLVVGLIIALLGPVSGGAANPARQLGPAALSGTTTALWAYLTAPLLGAALGAVVHYWFVSKRAKSGAYRHG
ncbi:MIP/aquaporin family protein [Streptomyces sp. NPDC059994]|uniref:MIP/aquaporin family protein n=1 Tax=Streptomyces sp. NPDC059994 TaxID=3347029 RepID=UPI0036B700BF